MNTGGYVNYVKDLKPYMIEMQFLNLDWNKVKNKFKEIKIKNDSQGDGIKGILHGINLRVLEFDDELQPNQARIIYSNNNKKIINVFEREED